tara:strand:- start:13522 stop:14013 length:492 start_codon:yes stop_codon:yes gene_type:complete
MASGNFLFRLVPFGNIPPAANFAALDFRNLHPALDFDGATNESAVFSFTMPDHYAGTTGISCRVGLSALGTSQDIDLDIAIERIGNDVLDVDADSFAAAVSLDAQTSSATAGKVTVHTVALTDGAQMDSLVAGEQGRLKITRDAASDGSVVDMELHFIDVYET